MLFVIVGIALFECFADILLIFRKGIFKSRRQVLMKKTKNELKSILKGVKGISKFNKSELVALLV